MSRHIIVHVDGNKMWREITTKDITEIHYDFTMAEYVFILESETLPDIEIPENANLEYDGFLMIGHLFPPLPVYLNTVCIEEGLKLSPGHFWLNEELSIPNFIMRRIVYNYIVNGRKIKTIYFYLSNDGVFKKDSIIYEEGSVAKKHKILSMINGISTKGTNIVDVRYGNIDINTYFFLNSNMCCFECLIGEKMICFKPKDINTLFRPLKRNYKNGYKKMNDARQPLYINVN